MKSANISEFEGLIESKIILRSRWYYALRVGGFFVGVVIPAFWLIWGVATGDIKHAVVVMLSLLPFGFLGFVLSFKVPVFCKLCRERLIQYWSSEVRSDGCYSGTISVCDHCKKYEARITYDFES